MSDYMVGMYLEKGASKFENGDYFGAVRELSSALSLAPRNHYCYYYRGLAYICLGSFTEARSDLYKALEINDDVYKYTDDDMGFDIREKLAQISGK